jgi:hypothetical protein
VPARNFHDGSANFQPAILSYQPGLTAMVRKRFCWRPISQAPWRPLSLFPLEEIVESRIRGWQQVRFYVLNRLVSSHGMKSHYIRATDINSVLVLERPRIGQWDFMWFADGSSTNVSLKPGCIVLLTRLTNMSCLKNVPIGLFFLFQIVCLRVGGYVLLDPTQ